MKMEKLLSDRIIPSRLFYSLLALTAVWLSIALVSPAMAQMVPSTETAPATTEIPEDLTHQEIRDLISRLSDEEVRDLIIRQLDRQAAEPEPEIDPAIYVSQLQRGFRVAKTSFERIFSPENQIDDLPALIWSGLTKNGRVSGWQLLALLIAMLVAGGLMEGLARRLLKPTGAQADPGRAQGSRFNLACYEMIRGTICLFAFTSGAVLLIEIVGHQLQASGKFWYQLLWCLVMLRLVALAVRVLTSSDRDSDQPSSAGPVSTQQVMAWSLLVSGSLLLPRPLINIVVEFGATPDTQLLLTMIAGALFIGFLIALIVRLRHYGESLILGEKETAGNLQQGLARIWWILSIVYVVCVWLLSVGKRAATGESSMVPGMGSLLLLVMIPYADRGMTRLITWYFRDKTPVEENDAPDDNETAGSQPEQAAATGMTPATGEDSEVETSAGTAASPHYIAIAQRYTRVILALIILTIFVRLWDIDLQAISANLVGPRFATAAFDISITVLVTWALWGMIRISIERRLEEDKPAGGSDGDGEAGGLGGSRVETVLPLIRISIKITLMVMAVLISLSALGVNIGPLIAGAGVVGIAIGFGAQTLVRDIVSGFFYLLDDAFRIGEYVVIDQIRGTVEKISVRSFQLRHHEGPVHTIPYGEIRTLTNWSRDWAIMKFELRVPFETDIEMVRKMIKQIGLNMMEDPTFGPLMLAPLKSQGVNRIDDSALIIRCKFTAIPGQQYLIRREAFTRIQRAFEEKGIQFAPRRVLVEATTPEEAIKAASASLDQEAQENQPPKDSM